MEDERIEAVKKWPEGNSVRDIQVFIGFTNSYRRFIQGFNKIAAPLTSMLKTSLSDTNTQPMIIDDGTVGGGDGKSTGKSAKSGSEESSLLTPDARLAFNYYSIKTSVNRNSDPPSGMSYPD